MSFNSNLITLVPNYKKYLSYLHPITLKKISTSKHSQLRVQLYHNQIQLVTPNAIYSQGNSYAPFRIALKYIQPLSHHTKTFLLLGAGMGSALKILQQIYQCYPNTTLVDIDETILRLAIFYMQFENPQHIELKCENAEKYIQQCTQKFDLIGIDVFIDTTVPQFIYSDSFIEKCTQCLSPNGYCIFNLIHQQKNEKNEFTKCLKKYFNNVHIIQHHTNYIYVTQHTKIKS